MDRSSRTQSGQIAVIVCFSSFVNRFQRLFGIHAASGDRFAPFGNVTDVHLPMDRETGRPRGFAFVTFGTEQESKLAAEKMNGVELDGRALKVNPAQPKEDSGGRAFGPDRRAGAFQARYRRR